MSKPEPGSIEQLLDEMRAEGGGVPPSLEGTFVARKLVAIAREIVAVQSGPISEALTEWNALHDMEQELQMAAKEYDIASSYPGNGSREAKQILKAIMLVKRDLEAISMKKFAQLTQMEQKFIQKHGTPQEFAESERARIFPASDRTAMARELVGGLGRGDDFENDAIRVHRWNSSVKVWDLENAGKRGKRVNVISIYDLDIVERSGGQGASGDIEDLIDDIIRARSYAQARKTILDGVEKINSRSLQSIGVDEKQERGVDVAPAGFGPIEVNGEYVYVNAEWDSFTVRDKEDQNNLPTCIPAIKGGKSDIKVFYRWVQDNKQKILRARFNEVTNSMSNAGIRYHYFCAMD